MSASTKRLALVTGGNRGLGLETGRQLVSKGYQVILTARNEAQGASAAAKVGAEFFPLDVTLEESLLALQHHVKSRHGRLDVLINNAGVFSKDGESVFSPEAKIETIRTTMETNVYGPIRLCQLFGPMMREAGYGRIVNVSSGMGQLSEMNGGYPGYRISKTSLNAVTRIFADELEGSGVLVNSVCPGWVKTDMGGAGAELEVEQGADTIVWLAMLPDKGPTGGFFRERVAIAW